MPEDVSEVFLLCGGDSERLGFPKEMLRVEGVPLAVKLVNRLRRAFGRAAVVTNRSPYLEHWLDVPIHPDRYPGQGPLAGIHSGLCEATGDSAFFLACDMPFVTVPMMKRLAQDARTAEAGIVTFRTSRGPEPLCGVYRKRLLPEMEKRLREGSKASPWDFARAVGARFIPADEDEARRLRDVDSPADLRFLREVFDEVEPLPVHRRSIARLGEGDTRSDLLVEEHAVAFYANQVHLVTIDCLPGSLRELAVGLCVGAGLAEELDEIHGVEVDYRRDRVTIGLEGQTSELQRTLQRHLASGCGARPGVGGGAVRAVGRGSRSFHVGAGHILDVLDNLRRMAPVFQQTGATHQAAFSDGQRVLYFAEDVGRHNAVDKVLGGCLLREVDLERGVLVVTGRLNAQIVEKVLRCGVPVLASRSAATARAAGSAARHGLTLVGFARGRRMNVYTHPERVNLDR